MVKETILLVEDDASVRRLLSRVLRMAGYDVREAADGVEALQLWAHHQFSLVITDLDMPEMSGEELILRLLVTERPFRFLVISGRPKPLPATWPCLAKPFSSQTLLQLVESLLNCVPDGRSAY